MNPLQAPHSARALEILASAGLITVPAPDIYVNHLGTYHFPQLRADEVRLITDAFIRDTLEHWLHGRDIHVRQETFRYPDPEILPYHAVIRVPSDATGASGHAVRMGEYASAAVLPGLALWGAVHVAALLVPGTPEHSA